MSGPARPSELRLWRFLGLLARSEDYPPKDGPYQDYTYFQPASLEEVRGFWRRTLARMRRGLAPAELGLYLHWPFCPSQCAFCFCSMTTAESAAQMSAYAAMLRREMDALKDLFRGASFTSFYIGGGTPTFMEEGELDHLLAHLRASFRLEPGAQFYVEASPATLNAAKLAVLRAHGVNRVTLGVQSLDEEVLRRAGRAGQTRAVVEKAFGLLAAEPGLVRDIDLIFGLDGQSRLSFLKDLGWALSRRPDVLHFYGFDPRPQTRFAASGGELPAPARAEQGLTLALAERMVRSAGYRQSSWEGRPEGRRLEERQDGALRRLGGSVLGLGPTAKSHAFGSAWYEHRPVRPGRVRTEGLPPFFAFRTGPVEEARGHLIRSLALSGGLCRAEFRAAFGRDVLEFRSLRRGVESLRALGRLEVRPERLILPGRGPVDRLVWLKRLYGPRLVRAILAARRADWERFLAADASSPERVLDALAERSRARGAFRVYYSPWKASRSTSITAA